MEKTCDFLLGSTNQNIANLLKSLDTRAVDAGTNGVSRRFSQEEEFFLLLEKPVTVPSLDIHHDVSNPFPAPEYLAVIQELTQELTRVVPSLFVGLSWFFDPRDTLHPLFVQVLSAKEKRFLYVLRIDLTYRSRYGQVLERGTNSRTPRYQTHHLFLESEVLPLASMDTSGTEKRLYLAKLFQNTWKGESGRRYHIEGQWIDQDITKFLTRAVLTPGRKTFPYYPLRCRFNTLSATCVDLDSEGRRRAAAILDTVWNQVAPHAAEIQKQLQEASFSEENALFRRIRESCRPLVEPRLGNYRLEAYLSPQEQKEYSYHDGQK